MYIFTGKNIHLVIVSFVVYIFVNMTENVIHYNIGRRNNMNFELPNTSEFMLIFIVMITFAAIQGLLTIFFNDLK